MKAKGAGPILAVILSVGGPACGLGHRVVMLRDERPFAGAQPLVVRADLPDGKMEISRGGFPTLFELKLSYCRDHFRAQSDFRTQGNGREEDQASLLVVEAERLELREHAPNAPPEPNLLSLRLRPGVPLDLRFALGRGEAQIDLTVLSVTRLSIHGGTGPARVRFAAGNPRDLGRFRFVAGSGPVRLEGLGWGRVTSLEYYGGAAESSIDWSGPGPDESAVFLDLGTGGLTLSFPSDLGVSLSGGGIPPDAVPEGFRREGRGWESLNRPSADRHLTLVIDGGIDALRFNWKR